jgi:hypothetical protein
MVIRRQCVSSIPKIILGLLDPESYFLDQALIFEHTEPFPPSGLDK